jgi:hypothetical protein
MRKILNALLVAAMAVTAFGLAPARAADGEDPILVGVDGPNDGAITGDATLAPLGMDELAAYIHQPDYSKNEIEFVWQLTDLALDQPLPEIQRYLWQMTIGGKEFWIQAKTTDVTTASTIPDDPQGQLTHIPSIRLRGNCSTVGVVATCHQLLWLDGDFDTAAKQVRIRVPLDNPAAPEFTAGARITSTNIETGFQVVISDANTTDEMFGCSDYTIPVGGVSNGSDGGCE